MKKSIITLIIIMTAILLLANPEYIGKINKHKIKTTEYMLLTKNEFESFAIEHGATPTVQEQILLKEKAWNKLVEGYILKDIYKKYKISVSSNELLDTLRLNPPEVIKKSPQFYTKNGEFDFDKYEKSLKDNKPVDLDWVKQYYYISYIPYAKLKKQVISNRKISEEEIVRQYIAERNEIEGKAIIFKNDDFKENIDISQDEIIAYYRRHISDYEIPASCHLKWVKFPVQADRTDSLFAKAKADSLYQILSDGRDFSLIAGKYSDGVYAKNKGYAGYMELKTFPKSIRQSLEDAEINKVLPPYYMNGSYYIFKLTERTVSMVKLMIVQVDIKATDYTIKRINKEMEAFREMGNNVGFEVAAKEFQYSLEEKDTFNIKDVFIPGIGPSENIIRLSLRTQPGVIFEPIKNDKMNAYYVFYVHRNTPRSFKKIQDVSSNIISEISNTKSGEFTYKKALNWQKEYGKNIMSQADSEGIEVFELRQFRINSKINNQLYPIFNYEVLNQGNNKVIVVKEDNCTIIAQIDQHKDVSMLDYSLYKDAIKNKLQQINQDKYFDDFMQKEKAKAKVKDYRNKLN